MWLAREAEQRYLLTEIEHLLREPGCPACTHVLEAERSFFSWFGMESFTASEVQAQLRASMGMCASHTRRLIEEIGEGHVMTTVMRHAVLGARGCIRDTTSAGQCPACEVAISAGRRAIRLVSDGLTDPAHARLYAAHAGMCVPHVVQAALVAETSTLKLITERLCESLTGTRERPLVEKPTGAGWRRVMPSSLATPTPG